MKNLFGTLVPGDLLAAMNEWGWGPAQLAARLRLSYVTPAHTPAHRARTCEDQEVQTRYPDSFSESVLCSSRERRLGTEVGWTGLQAGLTTG